MRTFVAVAGVLIGAFLSLLLLLFNPVSLFRPDVSGLPAAARTLSWSGGGFAGFGLTPRGLLGMGDGGNGAAAFRDAGIRYARAEVVMLQGTDGAPPALGVRLSAIGRGNSLLQARLGVVTDWDIVWPGEGSLLLSGSENFWAPLRDGLWSAVRGRGFRPQESYLLQPLPGLGPLLVIGGTGALSGAQGEFRELYFPVDAKRGEFTGRRELQVSLR